MERENSMEPNPQVGRNGNDISLLHIQGAIKVRVTFFTNNNLCSII